MRWDEREEYQFEGARHLAFILENMINSMYNCIPRK